MVPSIFESSHNQKEVQGNVQGSSEACEGPLRPGEGPLRPVRVLRGLVRPSSPATPHGRISAEIGAWGPDPMFPEMGDAETRALEEAVFLGATAGKHVCR